MRNESADAGSKPSRQSASVRADRRPIILLTPDLAEKGGASTEREYVVRANYAEAIAEAGGLPLILPYVSGELAQILQFAEGIVVTGAEPGAEVLSERRDFERRLVEAALRAGKPLLGICHGMQLIGEHLGGQFVTEIPASGVSHSPSEVPDAVAHEIIVEEESLLAGLVGTERPQVNSLHRHALSGQGRFTVAARASDGVMEAFEGQTGSFCLGVQWHPEYRLTQLDMEIFRQFVARCGEAAISRSTLVHARLSSLGLSLPEASVPPGTFVGAVRTGNMITVSGQVPQVDGVVRATGQLGADVSIEDGRDCARICLFNVLAQLERAAGGLDRVRGFVRLAGYVAASADFTRHGTVIEAASELLRELFPDCWEHARIAIGVSSLPRGVPVEIELTALVADEV